MAPGAGSSSVIWSIRTLDCVCVMTIKSKSVKSFIESHRTCAWSRGNTCKFWGCSHRELYSEIETEHDYDFFMANSACKQFKSRKNNED